METLKRAEDVQQPDERNLCWVRLETGEPVTCEDHYSGIISIHLDPAVPDEIRSYFATIQNLCVYGWFAYDFYSVAMFMSYAMIEMALRARSPVKGKDNRPFKKLLQRAVESDLVQEKSFSHARLLRRQRAEGLRLNRQVGRLGGAAYKYGAPRNNYLTIVCETLPELRNMLAHPQGSTVHMPGEALSALRFSAEFANQLFSRP